LKRMHAVGLKWAEKFLSENASLVFRLGYHSVCRVYIQDIFSFFTSPAQKKKRK
jgi:aprataxin